MYVSHISDINCDMDVLSKVNTGDTSIFQSAITITIYTVDAVKGEAKVTFGMEILLI